jgi:subtilisin family serine protease
VSGRRLALLIGGLLAACTNPPLRIGSSALPNPDAARPDRYIIAAVDNGAAPFVARAGSTPRGYDAVTVYGPAAQAVRLMQSLEHDYGLREVSAWPIRPLNMHCAVLEIPASADRAHLVAALAQDRRVRLAQPLQTFVTRSDPYNDPYVGLQRGFRQMQVAQAQHWSQGEGVKIALIDTGADTHHPDLARNVIAAENFVDSNAERFRADRHGTEMAGIIAAVANNGEGIVGVAPESRLLIFKACWQARSDADAASCNSFTLARALDAALEARVQVVNLSLSGPADPLLAALIQEGARRGILFVGAASGLMDQHGVIEVTSSDARVSEEAVLHAPGREILTLMPGGRYDFATGDSVSTAQVTGVVALMLARDRSLTAGAAFQLLHATSAEAGDGSHGTVDACAALAALLGQGTCRETAQNGPGDTHDHPGAIH